MGRPVRYEHLPADHLLHQMEMVELDEPGADAVVELDLTPIVGNHIGGLQGGLVAALVDVVAGCAVRRSVPADAVFATSDMTVHYLAPMTSGPIRATARVRRRGKRSLVLHVDVEGGGEPRVLGAVATIGFVVIVAGTADEP